MIIIFLPHKVFAMDPITDDEMNTITGAVGVHIYVEGELTQPAYQVLQWQGNKNLKEKKRVLKQLYPNKADIYEISYDDCELRFHTGKTEQDVLINVDETGASNRSLVKVSSPKPAPEISTGTLHLSFKEISVQISNPSEAIHIIPR
jgi:hypothetical protein